MNPISICHIQPLNYLRLPQNTLDETSFSPYSLTNNRAVILELIDDPTLKNLGTTFGLADSIIYLNGDYPVEDSFLTELSVGYLENQAYMFLIALWIVKDHAIGTLPSSLRLSQVGKPVQYTYHEYGQRYFTSAGKGPTPTEYTREDIRVGGEYYQDYLPNLQALSDCSANAASQNPTFVPTEFDETSTRLYRFVHLLNHARTLYDIGLKLALFCCCLECLFADPDDTQDVTLRVAQRTTLFVETDPSRRQRLFKRVKQAYSMRSKVIHGGRIKKTHLQELGEVCVETDAILRTVFATILKAKSATPDLFKLFTTDESHLKEYFDELVFSTKPL